IGRSHESRATSACDDRLVTGLVEQLITEGRGALRAGDAARARAVFEQALGESASGEVIEGLARASYLDLDYPQAIEEWEQAYAAHRDKGDLTGAVRVARMLAYMHGTVVGDRGT